MRLFTTALLSAFIVIVGSLRLKAQCNSATCTTPVPQVNAADACILPGPSALDCYYGATTPDAPISFPPSWCTTIHNNHWFAFTADAATATFSISCFGCASGNGIQAAVLSTADCVNFQFVSPCLGNIPTQTTQSLTATGLTIGNVYYLCIDGSGGALCDYAINGEIPTVTGPANGVCVPSSPNSTYSTAGMSVWTINPLGAGNFVGPSIGNSVTVHWVTAGPAEVCAQNVHCPDAPPDCFEVNVGEDVVGPDEIVNLCQNQSVTCAGKTFTAPGTFMVHLPTYLNCDSLVKCKVNLIPTVYTDVPVNLCQGQSVTCAGEEFYAPGTFPVKLSAWQGCDSIVNCKVKLIPTYISPFYLVNLCDPGEYVMCNESYTSSGLYSKTCTNWQGCDSIVNVNLAVMAPDAVIAPPAILDCTANATITLNGSGSSTNNAAGGLTFYSWSGPGIVGANNTPNIQVNQPGQYCLILRLSRGGVNCSDTACVNVTAFSAVPQLPVLSGTANPCFGTTQVYTATAVGNPTPSSYTWTVPAGVTYTNPTPNTLQITWNTTVTNGDICVKANNSCGSSQAACMPISVQPALITPVLSGPASVCANGGNYLYTLNIMQANTSYTWTVPTGAVLTGSGDSVMVNFLNAVSGSVCVVAQNLCGTSAPICQAVTVRPVPTADLAQSAQICAGESANLTFTLGGNGPFDVVWSNGVVNSTLTDISTGHVETVSPAQTTTYSLISIQDNSNPTCSALLNDNVTITVRPNVSLSQTFNICEGQTKFLAGAAQSTSGVYVDSLNTIYGCDSIVTSTLIVHDIDTLVISTTSCNPAAVGTTTQIYQQFGNGCDSVVIKTITLLPSDTTHLFDTDCDVNNTGVFSNVLTNIYGCDSTIIRTVTFALSDTTYLTGVTCDPNATGVFYNLLTTQNGCDSLLITNVSLLPHDTTLFFGTSCNPNNVGIFQQDYTSILGCDSTVITTVTFFHLDSTFLTAGNCDPALTGIFSQTLLTAAGCDSVIITNVSLLPSNTTNLSGTSCNPNNVGVFQQDLTNIFGCDSTVITTVTFFHLDSTFLTAGNCDPALTGIFSQTLLTAAGCDSVIITNVSLLPSNTTNLSGASCNPSKVGVFQQDLTNIFGCDSTVITTVTFFHLDSTFLTAGNCDPAMTGIFSQTLLTAAGCDSVIITNVSLLPSNTTNLSDVSCNPNSIGVFTHVVPNQFGCDSTIILTVTFSPTDSVFLTATTCDPNMDGVFTQNLITPEGCDSTVVTTVTLLPSNTTALQTTTCDPALAGVFVYPLINQFGCDSIVTETRMLLPHDTTTLTFSTCDPAMVGTVTRIEQNQWGCDSIIYEVTSLLPASSCGISALLAGSNIPCGSTTGSLTITATLGEIPFSYSILLGTNTVSTGTLTAVGQPKIVTGLAPGNYTLQISSINGFSTTAQAVIIQLTPPLLSAEVLSNYNGFSISCSGETDGAALATATAGKTPYQFAWSNGGNTAQISNLGIGTFSVTVTDANACTNTASVILNGPTPLSFNFTVNHLDCFGQNDGAIYVEASGGATPYRYIKNNSSPQDSNAFMNLSDGTYKITVLDANDCQKDEIIIVNAAVPVVVNLGNNQTIELGGSTVIEAIVNVPLDSILSVAWTPPFDSSECPGCLSQVVAPFITTTYSVEVTATNGCSDEDKVTVLVDRRRHLYVPNVFSPNDDSNNDLFTFYAKPGTVKKFRNFQIYDRWGEAIFYVEEFQPNDPAIGWNGTYKGKPLNPGVYVWYVEVEFIDGVVELFKGDVTVVR